jgi:pimeloyl-ACP methyl ester carboxylesterase
VKQLSTAIAGAVVLAACAQTGSYVRASDATPLPISFHVGDAFPDPAEVTLPDGVALQWHRCGRQPAPWQCATLEVPLDYRRPWLDSLSIAVIRHPATDSSRRSGSLLVNPGGPGESGILLASEIAATLPPAILQRFDLVGFDPRGIGQSTPLTCDVLVDATALPDPQAFQQCVDDNSTVLPHLGTVNVARDLEQLRKAVGDRQLTFLGYSYGTALGSVYATLFPDKVRAMVLDGSVNPSAGKANARRRSGLPNFYGVQRFERSRRRFLHECSIAATCPLGPQASTVLANLESRLLDDGLPAPEVADVEGLTSEVLHRDIVAGYYNSDYWPYLAQGISEAAAGDGSLLVALAERLRARPAALSASQEAFDNLAVACADFADRSRTCRKWPLTAEPLPPLAAVDRAAPILVLGTDGDPATPVEQAGLMAAGIGNAVTVYWAGDGHTAFLRGSACIDTVVADYLVNLKTPPDGTRCPESDTASAGQDAADLLFSMANPRRQDAFVRRAVAGGDTPQHASCLAGWYVAVLDQAQLAHIFLDVPDDSVNLALRSHPSPCTTG